MTWQRLVVSCLYEPSEVQPILLSLRFAMTRTSQMLRLPIIYLLIASSNRPTRNTNWLVSTHQSLSHHLIANKFCPSLAASTAGMVSMADSTPPFTMMMFMTQSILHWFPWLNDTADWPRLCSWPNPSTMSCLHAFPMYYATKSTFKLKNLLEKGSKFEEDKNTKSWWWWWSVSTAPQISWECIHFHCTIYYRIHFHARNLPLQGSKFKEEKGYHELMMVVLTCCPTVL